MISLRGSFITKKSLNINIYLPISLHQMSCELSNPTVGSRESIRKLATVNESGLTPQQRIQRYNDFSQHYDEVETRMNFLLMNSLFSIRFG